MTKARPRRFSIIGSVVGQGRSTNGRGYPPHLEPGNLYFIRWRGQVAVGRMTHCLVCNAWDNAYTRRGCAKFLLKHKRCGLGLGLTT